MTTARGTWRRLVDRARTSLFLLPMMGVVAAVVLANVLSSVDDDLDAGTDLPLVFTSTLDSARVLLSTIAAATISFAGIAFSVALLVIQRTSSQYSPRVVNTLFRDPFNRRIMAVVVGTFTYCLLVLRTVRAPADDGAEISVPNVSVSVALVLGIITILAIIAFIDHSAKAMDVSQILERVARESARLVDEADPERGDDGAREVADDDRIAADDADLVVTFETGGWVQLVDVDQLCGCTPAHGAIEVHTAPGRYAVPGAALCSVRGTVDDANGARRACRAAVVLGRTRTLQQDLSYGVRQTVDVALRALSPGINDPTTAQDAIFHIAGMLTDLLRRPAPVRVVPTESGGRVLLPQLPSHEELVDLAYDEIRLAAADQPTVCVYLLESIHQVMGALRLADVEPPARLVEQAHLIVAGSDAAALLPHDRRTVHDAHDHRFGRA